MTDDPPSGPRPYRLSDGERDEAISALADAHAEGRLDADEFKQRMAAASEATFATDLDPLFADLPARRRAVSPIARPPTRSPHATRRRPRPHPAHPPDCYRGSRSSCWPSRSGPGS